jgi:hypothetical protein
MEHRRRDRRGRLFFTRLASSMLAAGAFFTAGCIRDPYAYGTQDNDEVISVTAAFIASGTCSVRLGNVIRESRGGDGDFHSVTFCLSPRSFPLGPQNVIVDVKCGLGSHRLMVAFERKPVKAVGLVRGDTRKVPLPGVFYCSGDFCPNPDRGPNASPIHEEFGVRPDGTMAMDLEIPAGASATIDGQAVASTVEQNADGNCRATVPSVKIDLNDRLLDVPLEGLVGLNPQEKMEIKIHIVADDERSGVLWIPGRALTIPIAALLARVVEGPVAFGADEPDQRRAQSILVLRREGNYEKIDSFFGNTATLRTLDLVAFTRTLPKKRIARCGPYISTTTDKSFFWDATAGDEEVAVYERRTGKLVAKRVFPASYRCPELYRTWSYSAKSPDISPTTNEKALENSHRWLKDLVKARACFIPDTIGEVVGCGGRKP